MRILTLAFLFLVACSPRVEKIQPPLQIDLPFAQLKSSGKKALWFVTSNYTTGGKLSRLDLNTGAITQTGVVGSDALLVPDLNDEFFVLSRMSNDSIARVSDSSGRITQLFRLPARSNPQWAAQDQRGRVWVTTQELDQVFILDSELKNISGSIDLSNLKTADGNANLAQVVAAGSQMVVTAQRIHRSANIWKPDSQSGVAIISLDLTRVSSTLINLVNPVAARLIGGGVQIVGAGDYTSTTGANASLAVVGLDGFVTSQRVIDGKIIAVTPEGDAMIVHHPLLKRSCIVVPSNPLLCESSELEDGYVFSTIHQIGDVIFVAYKGAQKSEMWILSATGSFPLQKVAMDLPILSLVTGR